MKKNYGKGSPLWSWKIKFQKHRGDPLPYFFFKGSTLMKFEKMTKLEGFIFFKNWEISILVKIIYYLDSFFVFVLIFFFFVDVIVLFFNFFENSTLFYEIFKDFKLYFLWVFKFSKSFDHFWWFHRFCSHLCFEIFAGFPFFSRFSRYFCHFLWDFWEFCVFSRFSEFFAILFFEFLKFLSEF